MDVFRGRRYFAFAGIGAPQAFERQLNAAIGPPAGTRWFPDHHNYTDTDLIDLDAAARKAGAELLVTTEKDWVKVEPLHGAGGQELPIVSAEVQVRFRDGDADALLDRINARLARSQPPPPSPSPSPPQPAASPTGAT
jgi:tetraacyldisaccharide 4'-kinase